jgi:D-alanyl-D-alanine carboxypeptidase
MAFRLVHSSESEKSVPINDATLKGKYNWLYENAHKYGFIVRYPEKKAAITGQDGISHIFRYVGVAHATYIYENDLCLEEYLKLLRDTYTYENPLAIKGADGKSYQVYYAEADESSSITVSTRYSYEISGDNMNGYIVTMGKSQKSTKN